MFAKPPLEDHSTMGPDQGAGNNPTAALYRAALGPVNTQRYLAQFERFDAAGRASLVWNPAAGLCTLNWMAFRGLWGAALVYLAAAEGLALLVLGVGRQYLHWPTGVEIGVLGSLLMLSILIPGLYGNALLHADIRRRMASAVTDAHTVREACEALARQAPSQQRLKAFWLGNLVLGLLLLAVAWFLWTGRGHDADAVATVDATSQPGPPPPTAVVVRTPLPPAATEPAPPEPSVPAQTVPPAPLVEPAVAVEAVLKPPSAAPVVKPSPVLESEAPRPLPAAQTPPAVLAPPPSGPAPQPQSTPPAPRTPSPATDAPAARKVPPAPSAPVAAGSHGINVGLFAEQANALKVHAQLTEAGLPATMQTVEGARGPRTRVRAGPFPDRASADAAAQRIRAMGLEAQIYRQ